MENSEKELQQKQNKPQDKITVSVFAPRSLDPKEFIWKKNKNVGEAANEAASVFGYKPEKPPRLEKGEEVLDNTKNLVSEGVKDGDELELVGGGGGVSSN